MKLNYLVPIAFAILAPMSLSEGAIFFTETFSYPDGSLSTNPDWSTHSGTAGQIQVTAGTISLNDVDSEDVNRQIGATITSGTIFAGFDFAVTAVVPAAGGDYEYFAHFGNGTTNFTSRMDITAAVGAGDFTVGIAGGSGTADATWATDLTFGVTYRAIIGYDRDTGLSSVWIDPVDASSTSIVSAADTKDVTGFYFRQSGSSVNETITIDNLIVSTTFPEALAIPEPSLALLGGLGLLGLVRRRR